MKVTFTKVTLKVIFVDEINSINNRQYAQNEMLKKLIA